MKNKILNSVLIVGAVVTVVFIAYQYFKYSHYNRYQIDEKKIVDTSQFIWNIDKLKDRYDILEVSGWIAYKGEDINTWKLSMLIQNDDRDNFIVPMTMRQRLDVTKTFNDGFNYDYSGFSVTINKDYIKSGSTHYYILYQNNGKDVMVDINEVFGGGN